MRQVEITVRPQYTQVLQASGTLFREIDDYFAITVAGSWFSDARKKGHWDGKSHFFKLFPKDYPSRGTLPTGLLPRLERFLLDNKVAYRIHDPSPQLDIPEPILRLGKYDLTKPEYSYQADAVNIALARKRGVFGLATNSGKTIIAAALTETLQKPTLFIAGSQDIVLQTERVFKETLSNPDIGVLGAGRRELSMVTICTVQTLVNFIRTHKEELSVFSVVFSDEAHHLSANTWYKSMMLLRAPWRFALSGTPFSKDRQKNYKVVGATGELLLKITNEQLVQRGVSAKPTVYFHRANSLVGETASNAHYSVVAREEIVHNYARNDQICNIAESELKHGNHVLILTPRTQHALQLWNSIDHEEHNCWLNHGGVHRDLRLKNLDAFKEDGGIMIATCREGP